VRKRGKRERGRTPQGKQHDRLDQRYEDGLKKQFMSVDGVNLEVGRMLTRHSHHLCLPLLSLLIQHIKRVLQMAEPVLPAAPSDRGGVEAPVGAVVRIRDDEETFVRLTFFDEGGDDPVLRGWKEGREKEKNGRVAREVGEAERQRLV
jgi:hypothetical protein